MKRTSLMVLASVLIALVQAPAPSAQELSGGKEVGPASVLTQLSMSSEKHDYVGGGKEWFYKGGDWTSNTYDLTGDGLVDYVDINYSDSKTFWHLSFATNKLGKNLEPGKYTNAQRAAFAETGHPGMDVSGDGRGCNTQAGSFTILEAKFDYSGSKPKLVSFAVNFEQHCEGAGPALWGALHYNSTAPNIVKAKYKSSGKLTVTGYNFDGAAVLNVDGKPVTPAERSNELFLVKKLKLAKGTHKLQVVNPGNVSSDAVELKVK